MYEMEEQYHSDNMEAISRMLRRAQAAGYGASYGRYVSDYDPPQKPKKKRAKTRTARVRPGQR